MHDIKIIALDLDGTLLNSNKELSPRNLAALERAAAAGIQIVPTTGRFYSGMPESIRSLPFIRYVISINGAEVRDLSGGEIIYRAEMPWQQCIEMMRELDGLPLLYDCYMDSAGWMTASMKSLIDDMVDSPHYREMLHRLRRDVPELKAFLAERKQNVQKVQFFTRDMELRREALENLEKRYENICVSSSADQNVEINHALANKGEALCALVRHLGCPISATMSFGDGLNDLSMLRRAGLGVAMENACPEATAAADLLTVSCDEDGVAAVMEEYCFR